MTNIARLVLTNSVLTAIVTYFLTSLTLSSWAIKKIDKIRRNFFWTAEEEASGGKCMVNWRRICSPKEFGGLGIKNLECFGRALRLRWLWFKWDDNDRPWKGSATPCAGPDFALFEACTKISVGDGAKTLFWKDNWLNGSAPAKMAPAIFKRSRCKSISIKEGF